MDEIKDFEELKVVIYFHNCLVVFLYIYIYISLKHLRVFFFFVSMWTCVHGPSYELVMA